LPEELEKSHSWGRGSHAVRIGSTLRELIGAKREIIDDHVPDDSVPAPQEKAAIQTHDDAVPIIV